LFSTIFSVFTACIKTENAEMITDGMKPVYISKDSLLHFSQEAPRLFHKTGKIAYYRPYMFMVEAQQGVHVIDMTDTLNPVKLSFLNIPAVQDVVVSNNTLYTDNGPHMLVLDITNIRNIRLINRMLNIYQHSYNSPIDYKGYFECVDLTKGWVVSWDSVTLKNPLCRK
jgi:hypothetical protein